MRKLLLLLALVSTAASAAAPDSVAANIDGGSIITSTDGGGPLVTIDTGVTEDWVATLKCKDVGVHYLFSTDSSPATTGEISLEPNKTFDILVIQGKGEKYRYLSLLAEDGGTPYCRGKRNAR